MYESDLLNSYDRVFHGHKIPKDRKLPPHVVLMLGCIYLSSGFNVEERRGSNTVQQHVAWFHGGWKRELEAGVVAVFFLRTRRSLQPCLEAHLDSILLMAAVLGQERACSPARCISSHERLV